MEIVFLFCVVKLMVTANITFWAILHRLLLYNISKTALLYYAYVWLELMKGKLWKFFKIKTVNVKKLKFVLHQC